MDKMQVYMYHTMQKQDAIIRNLIDGNGDGLFLWTII